MRQADFFFLFCLAAFTVGFLLLVMPVEVHFYYRWKAEGHFLFLKFGIFQGRLAVGTKLLGERSEKSFRLVNTLGIKAQGRAASDERTRFSFTRWGGLKFPYYRELFRRAERLAKNSRCRRLVWETDLGFQDYALTGVATGVIWAAKGIALGGLSRFLKIDSEGLRVDVTPHFGSPRLETRLDCILMTRLGYIINTFSYFLIWWIKITWRRGVSRSGEPSDRNSHENRHGEH